MFVNEITMNSYREIVDGKNDGFSLDNKHYNSFPEIISSMNTAFYKLKNRGSVHIYSVSDDNVVILVAAVTLQITKKQVVPVGAINYFDYADFFYNGRTKEKLQRDAFWSLLRFWAQKGYKTLYMKYLPQTSMTKKFIEEKYGMDFECVKNVSIPFRNDFETYWKSLSKHTRQNLRTAENRLRTDGHVLHFIPPLQKFQ